MGTPTSPASTQVQPASARAAEKSSRPLNANQQRVLEVLTVTRLLDLFSVHPSVEEAVRIAGSWWRVAAPVASPVVFAAL